MGRHSNAIVVFCLIIILLALSSCKKEMTAADEASIKDVIIRYDMALIEVYLRGSVKPLAEIASVREANKITMLLTNFEKKKVFMESEMLDIKFEKFTRMSAHKVDTVVKEKWRWRHLDRETKREVKAWRFEDYRLLYHMERDLRSMKWLVNSVEFVK